MAINNPSIAFSNDGNTKAEFFDGGAHFINHRIIFAGITGV